MIEIVGFFVVAVVLMVMRGADSGPISCISSETLKLIDAHPDEWRAALNELRKPDVESVALPLSGLVLRKWGSA